MAPGPAAGPGLGRKLPHYGKYSYLGFEGEEPTNVIKGQWPASDSPLRVDLRQTGDSAALSALRSPPRRALAELPPVFSQTTLLGHVSHLASPALEGRGIVIWNRRRQEAGRPLGMGIRLVDPAPAYPRFVDDLV